MAKLKLQGIPIVILLCRLVSMTEAAATANEPFRFDGSSMFRPTITPSEEQPDDGITTAAPNSSLVWQPLRASFRPLNRQLPPLPPAPLTVGPEGFDSETLGTTANRFGLGPQPVDTTAAIATTSTPVTIPSTEDLEDQPTRAPMNRFRPTRPPSLDPQVQPPANSPSLTNSRSHSSNNLTSVYRMTNECFECICEASTSCNIDSRCQTSDVRHTRCGMFLISYDQWLETGLSRELVTREALARDAAADERAFYECVTERDCAERLLIIYMQKNGKDCDKDGKIDCYDLAAIHQGGTDQCNGEALLDSQYWSDFNACIGFERKRRR